MARAARAILEAATPEAKVAAAHAAAAALGAGEIRHDFDVAMPDRPARPSRPQLLPPAAMPRRGKAGSPRARFALLHALAHIEFNAIDLAADMAGRFGATMPREFAADWLWIAAEEATHFTWLCGLLQEGGGTYGDLPAHDGLWEAAAVTAHSLEARLAVVPQVLEARGLDVTPAMIARFRAGGDMAAARVLGRILADEVRHVAAGNRWFVWLARESGARPEERFQALVRAHFRGALKPPFNISARAKAGLTTEWYTALEERRLPSP